MDYFKIILFVLCLIGVILMVQTFFYAIFHRAKLDDQINRLGEQLTAFSRRSIEKFDEYEKKIAQIQDTAQTRIDELQQQLKKTINHAEIIEDIAQNLQNQNEELYYKIEVLESLASNDSSDDTIRQTITLIKNDIRDARYYNEQLTEQRNQWLKEMARREEKRLRQSRGRDVEH